MAPIIGRNRSAGSGVVPAMPNYRRVASLPALLLTGLLVAACATAPSPAPTSAPPSDQPSTASGPHPASRRLRRRSTESPSRSRRPAVTASRVPAAAPSRSSPTAVPTRSRPSRRSSAPFPVELMQALIVEVHQADFEAIKSHPFTDTCPIAFDGQQFIYTFTIGAGSERIDSCEVVVDPANPLFIAVDAAIASVAPR